MKDAAKKAGRIVDSVLTKPHTNRNRYLIGITGIPGAGKTTLAEEVKSIFIERGYSAQVVPMDGFHLFNERLSELGMMEKKGSPETYDIRNFLICLDSLRNNIHEEITCPQYSRVTHNPVMNAVVIEPGTSFIIVEGNYLLLDKGPWIQVRQYLDEVWYLDLPLEIAISRVRERHVKKGFTLEEAEKRIQMNDLPNAIRVHETRDLADRTM